MEEKVQDKQEVSEKSVELVAIPKDYAIKRINEILKDPEKKAILDEYILLINSLNIPVKSVEVDAEEVKESKSTSKKSSK